MKARIKEKVVIVVSIFTLTIGSAFLSSCGGAPLPAGGGSSSVDYVYLWIGADKDAYTSLMEPETNYGDISHLSVAFWGGSTPFGSSAHMKKAYVHFHLPILPTGTIVHEAYIELYHNAQSEDGHSDDVSIPVNLVDEYWDPTTLTWNDQPCHPSSDCPSTGATIDLQSFDWSSSGDIAGYVENAFDDPDSHHGFLIHWADFANGIEKGFVSNNHHLRTATDMYNAPRLLVKLELPSGTTVNDIVQPAMPADSDISFSAGMSTLQKNLGYLEDDDSGHCECPESGQRMDNFETEEECEENGYVWVAESEDESEEEVVIGKYSVGTDWPVDESEWNYEVYAGSEEASLAAYTRARCWEDSACTELVSAQLVSIDECRDLLDGKGWGPDSDDCTAL